LQIGEQRGAILDLREAPLQAFLDDR